MLAFLDSAQNGTPTVPLCLAGWEPRPGYALCHRESPAGHLVGVGDPLIFDLPRRLHDAGEGWKVGLNEGAKFVPAALLRAQAWYDTKTVTDLSARAWAAPVILTPGGTRAFRVSYGTDWLPSLTPEQARAHEIATAARTELIRASQDEDGDMDMRAMCQWAAELLAITHHITPRIVGALALLDDALAAGVVSAATSINFQVAVP